MILILLHIGYRVPLILDTVYPGLRIRIHFIRTRIQHFRLNTDPDPDPVWIQGFNDQKLKKNYSGKFFFLLSKTTIYLFLGLHKERPSYRRSLHLSKENIQHFCGSFLPSWIRIRIPNADPDPLTRLNPDPIGIRIRIRNPEYIYYFLLQFTVFFFILFYLALSFACNANSTVFRFSSCICTCIVS